MPRREGQGRNSITPGQAQYVVERLIAERRVLRSEVFKLVQEIPSEIAVIEQKLAHLRGAALPSPSRSHRAGREMKPKTRRTHSAAGRLGLRFSGLIRHLPERTKAELKALRADKGIEAAIAAAVAANSK